MERRVQICQIEKWSYEIQERADAKWKRQTPIYTSGEIKTCSDVCDAASI
jgi:hypothetical protein